MAKFELNVYGENDEILKTYATEKARYGAFEEAIKFAEESKGKTETEMAFKCFRMLANFAKLLFPGLTEEEIRLCEIQDIISLAFQVTGIANPLAEASGADGENEKN